MSLINRRTFVIGHDLLMVGFAWIAAFVIRYNLEVQEWPWRLTLATLPIVLIGQGLMLWWTGLYRSVWRFASLPDLWNILRAVTYGTMIVAAVIFFAIRLEGVPRTVFILYPMLTVALLGGPRLGYRMWKDRKANWFGRGGRVRTLVIGAGRAGDMLVRDMARDGRYTPVAFLDDNPKLHGAKIQGITVYGPVDILPEIVKTLAIDIVAIAVPSATGTQLRRFVEVCEGTNVPFRMVPWLHDTDPTQVALRSMRAVAIEDLLGRDPVSLDWETIRHGLTGKIVLVTGGGGSIGDELCRQIGRLLPRHLIVVDHAEYNLYNIHQELVAQQELTPGLSFHCHLADVGDASAVTYIFSKWKPQVVFHAAAYKHVTILEGQVREAVRNNILGTRTLAAAAERYGCAKFVLISTDKAVNPANIMGATKRIAETWCHALNGIGQTRFITVRFGNVLGSAGSVVPLFQRQIERGGPVTVTNPDVTRFFMTIPEACLLIMQAGVMGKGGEIFVLDMGQPIKITFLAEQMIRLCGKIPGKDIEIVYTGLRPGEKLSEELFYDQENLSATSHEKILLARHNEVDRTFLDHKLNEIEAACQRYDIEAMQRILCDLVPGLTCEADSENNVIEFKRANG